ncbi:MAG: ABC transporter permease subunit [Bordetella sp.]|nr:MAG: ABC transporter permease subunit [Bordetella sp.]
MISFKRIIVIGPPFFLLILFLFIPFLLILKISLSEVEFGIPPYSNLTKFSDGIFELTFNLRHYSSLITDSLYLLTYLNSIKMALITTIFCIIIGYPMTYCIVRSSPFMRNIFLLGIILPFWSSLLLRVYAWVGILRNDGLLNKLLMNLNIINVPFEIYRTDLAVYIGMIYAYLPFFILPLYAVLIKIDLRLLEAAYDLGARPYQVFLKIIIPLSRSGILAGAMLVFIPAIGEYIIPEMLGGANTHMMGRLMWTEFFNNADWPMASAITCTMLLIFIVPVVFFQKNTFKQKINRKIYL